MNNRMNNLLTRSKEYPKFVRTKACLVCKAEKVDAHHMEEVGMGNNSKKPSLRHFSCVPLCSEHHSIYHSKGIAWFQKEFRVNLYREALSLLVEFGSGTETPFHHDRRV